MLSFPLTLFALLLIAHAGAVPTPMPLAAVPLAVASAPGPAGELPHLQPRAVPSSINGKLDGIDQKRSVLDKLEDFKVKVPECGAGDVRCWKAGDHADQNFGWWGGYGAPWGKRESA